MGNLWLKIKVWTKITILVLVLFFLTIFIFNNANKPVAIWVWFDREEVRTTALRLIVCMLLAGVLGTLLVRMAFGTIRQIRELRRRGQAAQFQKDAAEIRAKAAMLQTRSEPQPNTGANQPPNRPT